MNRNPSHAMTATTTMAAVAVGAIFLGAVVALPVITVRHSVPLAGYPIAAAWAFLAFVLIRAAVGAPSRRGVAACLLAAGALRLTVLLALNGLEGVETGNDYAAYLMLARNLIDGNGLIAHTSNYGWVRGLYPPLYPILLAGAGAWTGINMATVTILNSAIDLASACLLYVLGRRLGDGRVGLAAAAIYLVWPAALITAPLAQKEGLVTLLALVIVLMFHKMIEEGPGWREAALLGLATALMALTQPILALLPLSIGLVLLPFVGLRPVILFAARAFPFALVAMLPWWIRNWYLFGAFVPLTTSLGPTMMLAAADAPPPPAQMLMSGGEPALSMALAREAAGLIAADPVGFLARRITMMIPRLVIEDYDALRLAYFRPPIAWAKMMLPATQFSYACAAGFALGGLARRENLARGGFAAALVLACLVQFGLFHPWFQFEERHRHFMTPFLLLLAASFLVPALRGMGLRSSSPHRSG